MHAKSLQSCPTLCDPIDHSLPGSSVHGILQARMLCWVAMLSSGIFLIQGSNLCLLHLFHWQVVLYHQCHLGSPYCLGDSISDISEKLLQKCRVGVGKVSIYVILVKGWYMQSSHIFLQKVSALLMRVYCQLQGAGITFMDFSAFVDRRRCKNWAHKISS